MSFHLHKTELVMCGALPWAPFPLAGAEHQRQVFDVNLLNNYRDFAFALPLLNL